MVDGRNGGGVDVVAIAFSIKSSVYVLVRSSMFIVKLYLSYHYASAIKLNNFSMYTDY